MSILRGSPWLKCADSGWFGLVLAFIVHASDLVEERSLDLRLFDFSKNVSLLENQPNTLATGHPDVGASGLAGTVDLAAHDGDLEGLLEISDFLLEFEKSSPAHFETTGRLVETISAGDEAATRALFEELEDISIDYALMEKASRVSMLPASFGWDDLGAWNALLRAFEPDAEGNLILGPSIAIDSRDCLIVNDEGERATVALIGVEGLTVVMTGDAVLVMRTDRAQDVREVVKAL